MVLISVFPNTKLLLKEGKMIYTFGHNTYQGLVGIGKFIIILFNTSVACYEVLSPPQIFQRTSHNHQTTFPILQSTTGITERFLFFHLEFLILIGG